MLRTRGQLQLEAVTGGGWARLLEDLLPKILEALQATERTKPQEEGLGFSKASAVVRQVCAGWQAVHDALVTRLVFKRRMTDEAVGMLVRRFPAVVSVQFLSGFMRPGPQWHEVTEEGVRAVCSSLPALTSLDLAYCRKVTDEGVRAVCSSLPALTSLDLTWCDKVTDEGVRAVCSSLPALTTLDLAYCRKVTDEGVRAVCSSLPVLTSLNLTYCNKVTDAGMRAVSGMRALTSLNLYYCINITNEGVLALSSLPALTHLDLRGCFEVTAAGVQALRSSTAAPSLHIVSFHSSV
jgi:hypothetical protein